MQVQIDIPFEQLLKIVKTLPSGKLRQLKAAIEKESHPAQPSQKLRKILTDGPIASKKDLEQIEKNRKAINQWRTK